jgi:hypothetical protein
MYKIMSANTKYVHISYRTQCVRSGLVLSKSFPVYGEWLLKIDMSDPVKAHEAIKNTIVGLLEKDFPNEKCEKPVLTSFQPL